MLGRPERGPDLDPQGAELRVGPMTQGVVTEGGEEGGRAAELGELDGGHRASAARFLPPFQGVDDVSRRRGVLDPDELDPLHVSDHRQAHPGPPRVRPWAAARR